MAPNLPAFVQADVRYEWRTVDVRPAPADYWIIYRGDDDVAFLRRCQGWLIQEEVPHDRRTGNLLSYREIQIRGLPDRFERQVVPAVLADGKLGDASGGRRYVDVCRVDDLPAFYDIHDLTPPPEVDL